MQRCQAFREQVGRRILLLQSDDYFGTSECFRENFNGEAINRSGVVKISLYENRSCDEHAVYFWRWLNWRAIFITFLLSSNDLYLCTRIFWRKYSLNILKNTLPSIKWEVKRFGEEILLRVELLNRLLISYLISKQARLEFYERSRCKLIQGTYYIIQCLLRLQAVIP